MNADEIVRALREAPNYNAGTGTSTIEDEAADCIEALQAQLAAEKRRADAAVGDMKAVLVEGGYGCDYCKHERNQLDCAPNCSKETKLGGWEWRGVKEEA